MQSSFWCLILVIAPAVVGCGPYYEGGPVESSADAFIGRSDADWFVAETDDLQGCIRGIGEARLTLCDASSPFDDDSQSVACSSLVPVTGNELREHLTSRGEENGTGLIPLTRSPIIASRDHHGYALMAPAAGVLGNRFHVRYNERFIRLVRWGNGNRWGTEVDHTYEVIVSGQLRRLVTTRSQIRTVALEWFPDM